MFAALVLILLTLAYISIPPASTAGFQYHRFLECYDKCGTGNDSASQTLISDVVSDDNASIYDTAPICNKTLWTCINNCDDSDVLKRIVKILTKICDHDKDMHKSSECLKKHKGDDVCGILLFEGLSMDVCKKMTESSKRCVDFLKEKSCDGYMGEYLYAYYSFKVNMAYLKNKETLVKYDIKSLPKGCEPLLEGQSLAIRSSNLPLTLIVAIAGILFSAQKLI